jgi:DNA polymerase (family X)
MGEKTIENLRDGIDGARADLQGPAGPDRDALPLAERIVAALREVDGVVDAPTPAACAASGRTSATSTCWWPPTTPRRSPRRSSTSTTSTRTIASGETKTSVVTRDGRPGRPAGRAAGQLRGGAAVLHRLEGPQHPAPAARARPRLDPERVRRSRSTGKPRRRRSPPGDVEVVAAATEEDVYAALELPWIPRSCARTTARSSSPRPTSCRRWSRVEDLRATCTTTPTCPATGAIRSRSSSPRGRAGARVPRDHRPRRGPHDQRGLSARSMLAQRRRCASSSSNRGDIALLHGAELNIGVDGSLDYDDDFLAGFDWLVASVHSHFRLASRSRPPGSSPRSATQRDRDRAPDRPHARPAARDRARPRAGARRRGRDRHRDRDQRNLPRLDAPAEVIREGARGVHLRDLHRRARRQRAGPCPFRRRRRPAVPGSPRERVANTWDRDRFLAWVAAPPVAASGTRRCSPSRARPTSTAPTACTGASTSVWGLSGTVPPSCCARPWCSPASRRCGAGGPVPRRRTRSCGAPVA